MPNSFPKGYNTGLDWGDAVVWWDDKKEEKPLTKRCTCGTNIAMGYDAPPEFHSDYCELYEKR